METKEEQTYLDTLYMSKDQFEVWHFMCRPCANEFAEANRLVWARDPLRQIEIAPAYTKTVQPRPEGEEFEPISFEPFTLEGLDTPPTCETCDIYLEGYLSSYGVDYITDPANEFPQHIIKLYLGEN